ncbi:MAG TPA: trehalose-phosphatase, partial [Terriglobales bacterium]|nr:trehalose-phosphatase [Terriglobales bacterium]
MTGSRSSRGTWPEAKSTAPASTSKSADAGMKIAERYNICAPFFQQLRRAPRRALLLDYDGTLAPFTPDRTRAFPYREIPELVSRIMRHKTRVVLVSGRAATELLFLSGIHPHPEVWGSHGAERLYPDGSYEVETPPPGQRNGLQLANRSL